MLLIPVILFLTPAALCCMQTVESSAQLPPPALADSDLLVASSPAAEAQPSPSKANSNNLRLLRQDTAAENVARTQVRASQQFATNQKANNVAQSRQPRQESIADEFAQAALAELQQSALNQKQRSGVLSRQARPESPGEAEQTPIKDTVINRHRKLFKQAVSNAKTFVGGGGATENRNLFNTRKVHSAKTFEIVASHEEDRKKNKDDNKTIVTTTQSNNEVTSKEEVRPDIDMCANCPNLFMNIKIAASEICENWKAISDNFEMKMDKSENVTVQDKSELFQCKRSISCKEPHVIVKWLDYNMCDVHKSENGGTFDYSCNGTHWFMKEFPIELVICALGSDKITIK